MNKKNPLSESSQRIVALDYLRVIAVVILYFYHLGMIWVPDWSFHFKIETNWFGLQQIMLLSSPWRMGLLWFISGTSIYIMQKKWGIRFLITNRSNAILLPLLFGILFVVPVQLFVEMTQKGSTESSFLDFFALFYFGSNTYFDGFSAGVWHHIDVNHLWFLRSLWRFMLVIAIIHLLINKLRKHYGSFNAKWFVLLAIIPLITMTINDSDVKRDIYGFVCLLFGYLFGSSVQFWNWLKERFYPIVITAAGFIVIYEVGFSLMQRGLENSALTLITQVAYNGSRAVSLIAILALFHKFFTRQSPLINEANKYVFPLYVLHQSVLIIVAFLVSSFELSTMISMLLTLALSIFICVLLLLLCKYNGLIGLLLGKRPRNDSWLLTKPVQVLIAIVTLPLAIRLIGLV